MIARVVVVGLVVVQVVIAENMNFVVDYARIVDKEKVGMVICRVVGMDVDMAVLVWLISLSIPSPNLRRLVLVLLRRPRFPRHGCIP
jgi:hypothetical protein